MLSEDQLLALKKKLLAKGRELAEKLSALLEGKSPGGLDALDAKPGETPEEKVRRYMAVIQERITAIRNGTYGKCEHCGAELSYAELDEMPWADTCRECASKITT
jgi:RNA polymerase-binding transcription factor DksA